MNKSTNYQQLYTLHQLRLCELVEPVTIVKLPLWSDRLLLGKLLRVNGVVAFLYQGVSILEEGERSTNSYSYPQVVELLSSIFASSY